MVKVPKIAVIADFPTLEEVGSPFSGAASMHLKTSLRKAFSFTEHPLITRNVSYLYLSQNRLQQGLETEVFSPKELPVEVRHNFHEISYLKDTFVSDYLKDNLDKLILDLKEIQPDIIVLSGKWSFYFLACYIDSDSPPGRLSSVKSGKRGINYFGLNAKFRGSLMTLYKEHGIPEVLCLPIIPHAYQAMTSSGVAITTDYFKLAYLNSSIASGVDKSRWLSYKPETKVYDTFSEAKAFLENLLELLNNSILEISVDLETTAKTIDTIGIAYDSNEGHAIPFLKGVDQRVNKYKDTAYDSKGKPVLCFLGSKVRTYERVFSLFEEAELVFLITKILTHGSVKLIGQNFHYDVLFFKEVWLTEVHAHIDTMGLAHVLKNSEKKGLAYLCSLHLEHYAYWKDDLNAKDSSLRWHYCAKDALFTLQLKNALIPYLEALPEINQQYYWNKQKRTAKHVLRRMFSGLSIDTKMREQLDLEFTALYENAIEQIQLLVGYEFNIRSTPQVRALLIDCFGITPILDRKRKTPTFGNTAMLKYVAKYPKYAYLLFLILEAKSIAAYLQNFMRARLDDKNQLRSFIGVFGTKSYRFNSRKFLSGLGGNIMNWSTGDKISLVYSSLALEHQDSEDSDFGFDSNEEEEDVEVLALAQQESKLAKAPNSKQIVIPSSPEKFFVNVDLKAGDLHLVAWMADAKWVKEILLSGGDVYTVLGSEYYGTTLFKSDPRRQKFKMVCHALNYLGMPKTIAMQTGLSELEVLRIMDFYFTKNPEIVSNYQNKIINDCLTKGYTENPFGARYHCSTTDEMLDKTWRQKMVALPAQGGVADWINEVMDRADEQEPFQKYPMVSKLQNHDAGLWEVDKRDKDWEDRFNEYFTIELPFSYPNGKTDILTIPWDISTSEINYAKCK